MLNHNISRSELENLINEWIVGRNAFRNRRILISRLCDGFTYDDIAEMYGLSVRQTKNIVYKCEEILFKHI